MSSAFEHKKIGTRSPYRAIFWRWFFLFLLALGCGLALGRLRDWDGGEEGYLVVDEEAVSSSSVKEPISIHRHRERQTSWQIKNRLNEVLGTGTLLEQDKLLRNYLAQSSLTDFAAIYKELGDWFSLQEKVLSEDASAITFAAYETLAEVMAEREGEEALGILLQQLEKDDLNRNSQLSEFMTSVFRKWAGGDYLQAANFINSNRERLLDQGGTLGQDLVYDLARLWTRADKSSALIWMDTLAEEEKQGALRSAIGVLHHRDPETAGRIFRENKELPERELLAEALVRNWSKKDVKKALAWASTLDPSVVRVATAVAIDALAEENFENSLVAFQNLRGTVRDEASRHLSRRFYMDEKRDFDAAAEFLLAEKDGLGRNAGITDLVANWSPNKPEEAVKWLEGVVGNGDSRLDQAVIELGMNLVEKTPEQGANWLGRVQDSSLRQQFLRPALDRWFREKPDQVLNWLENDSQLPGPERDSLQHHYQEVFKP